MIQFSQVLWTYSSDAVNENQHLLNTGFDLKSVQVQMQVHITTELPASTTASRQQLASTALVLVTCVWYDVCNVMCNHVSSIP